MTNSFGDRLRALRKKSGLNQEELAERVGVHLNTISRWENGDDAPKMAFTRKLAQALDVPEEDLFLMSNSFGQRLRALRKKSGLNQEELAEKVGLSVMTIRRWEWNERTPRIEEIKSIAQALDIPEEDLLNDAPAEKWVLQIKIADNLKEDFIDMTDIMPCVAAVVGNPYGATLEVSGKWETFADDEKFMDLIEQVMDSREALLQLRKNMSKNWKKQ